jgi:hypothetical protein
MAPFLGNASAAFFILIKSTGEIYRLLKRVRTRRNQLRTSSGAKTLALLVMHADDWIFALGLGLEVR